ncbi:MAG: DNA adenine methylase [Pseudomonadota bacterium]
MANTLKNPFRYPGGKSARTDLIKQLVVDLKLDGKNIYEPFAGSAAVSIELVASKICNRAVISEKDPLIYSFWKSVFTNPAKLLKLIEKTPITLKTWHKLRPLLDISASDPDMLTELAFAGLFFNRTNFSGVIHSGPIGGQEQSSDYMIDCRFNRTELIARIEALANHGHRFEVRNTDALTLLKSIKHAKTSLAYVDPPYFVQGRKLYRFHYALADHLKLAAVLKSFTAPWILSYDKHDVIENLYEEFHHAEEEFRYSSRMPKRENELLITNLKARSKDEPLWSFSK